LIEVLVCLPVGKRALINVRCHGDLGHCRVEADTIGDLESLLLRTVLGTAMLQLSTTFKC
jgi:hypothetical protein